MILGIGVDTVNIDRISRLLIRHGDRFLNRVYTEGERAFAARMNDYSGVLAKRWAAKEACSKALGTGMKQGVAWRDIEVVGERGKMPILKLKGGASQRLAKLTPSGSTTKLHLTLSDDHPSAVAVVVIELVNKRLAEIHRMNSKS